MAENIKKTDLYSGWKIAADKDNNGYENGWHKSVSENAVDAFVPSIIQQFLPEYHGAAFYWCNFTPDLAYDATDKILLRFGGIDYMAQIWLNGKGLGKFESPEAPFSIDVTDIIKNKKDNLLAVRVVNPIDKDIDGLNINNIPHRNKSLKKQAGSNLNHGGIWFGVELAVVPGIHITDKFVSGDIKTGMLNIQLEMNNTTDDTVTACVEMNVYDKSDFCNKITGQVCDIDLKPGISAEGFSFIVPQHKLWDTDNPNLYKVEIILDSSSGQHRIELNFGFREFTVKDGFFYLNGKKIFLKSSHSGNAFPIGQMMPVADDHARKDFILAKASGFNCVRSIAGMFRPDQLDFCDEMGIMIYEECLASWQMGTLNIPIGDKEKMLERYDNATAGMIKRDRNHACIVAWGLLNETLHDDIFDRAVKFLPTGKALDPTRLFILSSGRFDSDFSIGSVSNPYVYEWENQWGDDGHFDEEVLKHNPYTGWGSDFSAGDFHIYPVAPMNDEFTKLIRTVGSKNKPVFLSEYGTGSLFHVIEEWRHFQQHGCRPDLEDSSWLEYQSRSLIRDWKRFGLEKVFPFPEMMLKESQRLNADVRYRDFNTIRSNPDICGFSLTGLLDHGMCGEGLWSYWRRYKPEMYDAVSDGWAPLRFCLFAKSHVYRNEEFEIEAVLANENQLKPGKYTADFAIIGDMGTVEMFSEDFEIADDSFAIPVMKRSISLDVPSGNYKLVASLREGGSPMGGHLDIIVSDPSDFVKPQTSVYVEGLKESTVKFLEENNIKTEAYTGQKDGIVLLGNVDAKTISAAKESAENGAKVIFLNSECFKDGNVSLLEIADDLKCVNYRDWLYHKECVMADNTVFEGLGHGLVDFPTFGQTFPHLAFEMKEVPDEVICPAFHTGYHAIKMAYGAFHCICGLNKGDGKIYLNCFDIENNISLNPAADRLLLNLINYVLTK